MAQTRSIGKHNHAKNGRSPKSGTNSRLVAGHVPSHLYRKGNIYYFRYALPKYLKEHLGGVEVRLSLRTAYVREAGVLAGKLRDAITVSLREMPMLPLSEIKARLAGLLHESADAQAGKLETYRNCDALQELIGAPHFTEPVDAVSLRDMARERFTNKQIQEAMFSLFKGEKLYGPGSESLTEAEREAIVAMPFSTESFFRLYAESRAHHLIGNGLFTETEFEENKAVIAKQLMLFENLFSEYVAEEESGNILGAQKLLHDFFTTLNIPAVIPAPQKQMQDVSLGMPPLLYSKAVEIYITAKLKEQSWKETNVREIRTRLNNVLDIVGDKPLAEISRNDMRIFMETLQQLPPNRTKKKEYKGKTIKEILAMKPAETLNVATINTIMEAVSTLFEWHIRESHTQYNPAKGLKVNDKRRPIDLRSAFSVDELKRIFAHPKFTQGKFKYPAYFWIPLIGLFTGMRLEEIAQLRCADLRKLADHDLWVFDVNEQGEDEYGYTKSVKNKNAMRTVPVHKNLIDLGLIRYHANVAKAGQTRLFPELNRTDKTTKLGKQPGKQFAVIIAATLENSENKSFHSLRHTFADFFKQRDLQNNFFRVVYGHDTHELATKQYGSDIPPEILYEKIIEKLDYGLDLSALMNSKFCLLQEIWQQ
jgi:integrase